MAKIFLTSLNLNLNELQNVLMHPLASDPGSPVEGQMWYNSTDNVLRYYDGSAVKTIGTSAGIGNVVEDTTPQLGGMLDVNGFALGDGTLELIKFAETGAAVNEITVTNAATGNGPTISATGDDTNIALNLTAKGTGKVNIGGAEAVDVSSAQTLTNKSIAASQIDSGTLPPARLGADSIDAITEIASALKTGADLTLVTGTAGTTNNLVKWDANGDAIDAGVAAGAVHTQNTDTGTTATSFDIESGGTGVKLKNSTGELQLKNLADNAYADLRVKNLVVTGTTTTVNSETITMDDNILILNNNETGTPSENGGIEIERGTSTNSQVLWDESSDYWVANDGTSTQKIARVYAESVGNASDTQITVTHNLGTEDVDVAVRYAAGTKQNVIVDWRVISTTQVRIDFAAAPSSNEFRVVVTG